MFIQTEATPNPATLKFIPGKSVLADGTADFRLASDASNSPLATRLFEIDGVKGVFLGSDFISVTKDASEWQHLKPAILGAIMEHYMSGAPVIGSNGANDEATTKTSTLRTPIRSPPSRNCWRRGFGQQSPRMAAISRSTASAMGSSRCTCAALAPVAQARPPPCATASKTC